VNRHSIGMVGIALGAIYVTWRAMSSLSGAPSWLALPLLGAEVFLFLIYVLDVWATWRDPDATTTRAGSTGSFAVVVTAYMESETVVRTTLLACKELRGCDSDSIYLIDDAHRADLEHLAERFGVKYVARHNPSGGRAGAMAYGLDLVEADFAVVLSADQVPHRGLIERTLGEFDENVAVVQVRLDYANTDSVIHTSHAEHDESWQFDVIAPAADARGAASWSSSGAVVRTDAIRAIGGYPIDKLSAELHATVRLQAAGWRVQYLNEALVTGLAPHNLPSFITQRTGWARGQLQLLASADSPLWIRGLTVTQRLHHVHTAVAHLTAVAYATIGVALLVALTQGIMPLSPSFVGVLLLVLWMLGAMAGRIAIGHGSLERGGTVARNLIMLELRLRALWMVLRRDARRAGATTSVIDEGGSDVVHHLQVLVGFVVALEVLLGLRLLDAVIGWPLRPLEGADLALSLAWGAATASITLQVVGAFSRRRQERQHQRIGVDYFGSVNGSPAWIVDLSAAGAGVVTTLDIEPGFEIVLGVDLEDTTVELNGIARSVMSNQDDSRRRVGVQLLDVPEDALDAILRSVHLEAPEPELAEPIAPVYAEQTIEGTQDVVPDQRVDVVEPAAMTAPVGDAESAGIVEHREVAEPVGASVPVGAGPDRAEGRVAVKVGAGAGAGAFAGVGAGSQAPVESEVPRGAAADHAPTGAVSVGRSRYTHPVIAEASRVKVLASSDDDGQICLTVEIDGRSNSRPAVASATASFDRDGQLQVTVSQSNVESVHQAQFGSEAPAASQLDAEAPANEG